MAAVSSLLTKDIRADRYTPLVLVVRFNGIYWPNASYAMQVRNKPGTPGNPAINLATVANDAQGIKRLLAVDATDDYPAFTVIAIQIDRASLEAMPPGPAVDAAAEMAYDLIVTPVGQPPQRRLKGSFFIEAGVTR